MKIKRKIGTQKIKTQLESNYGIGKIQSKFICNQLGISSNLQNNKITKYEKKRIMDYLRKRTRIINISNWEERPQVDLKAHTSPPIKGQSNVKLIWISNGVGNSSLMKTNISKYNKLPIVDNLKYIKRNGILNLIKKNTYRGFRHKKGLPVRGQRTRNRRTRKQRQSIR